MDNLEELLIDNNVLMHTVLTELRDIKARLEKPQTDNLTSKEALALLGLGNERYLGYFHKQQLLNRRHGAKGFIYNRQEVQALAEKIKNKTIPVPSIKGMYAKDGL